jgi:hypothetical protein
MSKTIINICAGMLFIGVFPLTYGYYTLLRVVACGVFAVAAFIAFERKQQALIWVYGFMSVLFNPIFPVYLSKGIWLPVDIAAGLLLLGTSNSIDDNPKAKGRSSSEPDWTFRAMVTIAMLAIASYFLSHPETWYCIQQPASGC